MIPEDLPAIVTSAYFVDLVYLACRMKHLRNPLPYMVALEEFLMSLSILDLVSSVVKPVKEARYWMLLCSHRLAEFIWLEFEHSMLTPKSYHDWFFGLFGHHFT
jgi:hypothetical protein